MRPAQKPILRLHPRRSCLPLALGRSAPGDTPGKRNRHPPAAVGCHSEAHPLAGRLPKHLRPSLLLRPLDSPWASQLLWRGNLMAYLLAVVACPRFFGLFALAFATLAFAFALPLAAFAAFTFAHVVEFPRPAKPPTPQPCT